MATVIVIVLIVYVCYLAGAFARQAVEAKAWVLGLWKRLLATAA